MAVLEEQSGAEPDAAAKQFVRRFDSDSASATAQFRQTLPQKAQAGKLLQQLNKLDRQDVALAVTDAIPFDAKTGDLVIVERARALVQTGSTPAAEQLLDRMRTTRIGEYAFNYNAGRVMADARLYPQALSYYEAGFRAKPTAQAAERVYLTLMGLERYDDAAAAIGRIIRIGSYREELAEDFAYLLRRIAPGKLDPELAFALASLPEKDEEEVAPALLPHLIASDLLDSVLAAVDRGVTGFVSWNDEALLNLIPYLERRGQTEHLLRVYEQSGDISPVVREQFTRLFAALPVERIAAFSMPDVADRLSNSPVAQEYREAEKSFSQSMDASAALAMIRLLPQLVPAGDAQAFYAREKRKLGRLAALVAERLATNADAIKCVADFVVHWARPVYAEFFSGQDMADLTGAIANAQRMNAAPVGSKSGQLREEFFRFHLDRRFVRLESLTNDFELCNIAQNYFRFSSDQRPAVGTPVGYDLAIRVGKPSMSLGGNKPLDVLTSYALMQDRPKFSLSQSPDYDEFCWWYMTKIAGARRAPPDCLRPEIVAYLNEILSVSDFSGVPITRFLRMVWMKSGEFRKTFDLGNFIDRILFVLDRIQNFLLRSSEHLPFFQAFFDNSDSVFGQVVKALSTGPSNLVDAVRGISPGYAAVVHDASQDILVIGHASKDSGLGRNYHMLKMGLTASGANVAGLDFDAHAATANEQLVRWRENCRTDPIVVFAVNANDAPDFFLKDRSGILMDTYNCGFFLWEVSTAPTVQKLGISLVDEIWAPTKYVADIYAPLKATHVVGKGLFRGDEPYAPRRSSPNAPFRFVTVFDFDSSVERKNPLAVVMAFQDAFRGNENVELIVKTSNVNPQHWSNAWKQWEHLLGASAGDKRVKIVNERYTGEQMVALVRDADCVVSLHRSEGFGYLMSDAMAFGTPVIATNYSGNADFANTETSYPVGYKLIAVPDGAARWVCEGAVWADADTADATRQMRAVFDNYDVARAKAEKARANIKEKYSTSTFAATLSRRIEAIRSRPR